MNMFTTATVLIIFALHDVAMSSQEKPLRSVVAKQDISEEEIACIARTLTSQLNDNAACANVATQLASLYESFDVVQSLSQRLNLFPELCRPECGQVLIDAWQDCNAYDDIEDVANLLIAMCASDGSSMCYSNFNELFEYTTNGERCYEEFFETSTCSAECSTIVADGIESYGCCVNAAIDYVEAVEDAKDEVAAVFSACGVTRPSRCTNSPLSSADHTVAVAVNVGIIAIVAAWQLI
jgi:hypothetical protein